MTKTITSLRAMCAVMKYASGSRTCSQLSIATRLKCHPSFTIQEHGGILLPMRDACRSYQSIVKEIIAIHAASRPIASSIKAKRQMRFGPCTLISKPKQPELLPRTAHNAKATDARALQFCTGRCLYYAQPSSNQFQLRKSACNIARTPYASAKARWLTECRQGWPKGKIAALAIIGFAPNPRPCAGH